MADRFGFPWITLGGGHRSYRISLRNEGQTHAFGSRGMHQKRNETTRRATILVEPVNNLLEAYWQQQVE